MPFYRGFTHSLSFAISKPSAELNPAKTMKLLSKLWISKWKSSIKVASMTDAIGLVWKTIIYIFVIFTSPAYEASLLRSPDEGLSLTVLQKPGRKTRRIRQPGSVRCSHSVHQSERPGWNSVVLDRTHWPVGRRHVQVAVNWSSSFLHQLGDNSTWQR